MLFHIVVLQIKSSIPSNAKRLEQPVIIYTQPRATTIPNMIPQQHELAQPLQVQMSAPQVPHVGAQQVIQAHSALDVGADYMHQVVHNIPLNAQHQHQTVPAGHVIANTSLFDMHHNVW